jgi:predicted lipoprotein with Yx(FWY)xxD motif
LNAQLKMIGPALAVTALLAGACGTSTGGSPAAAGSSSATKTESTSIGTVLADSSGHTIYELAGATASNPKCTGSCLSVWPAVMVNGKQLVVNGHPAFTFASDSAPGQTNGQGLTDSWGTWWALSPSGTPITTGAATSSSPSSSSTGGGYGW